ncbi:MULTISPECIES: histidinol-phosphate transaminase [unclassified Pseudoclavibacter]|uniref:histidinol-phosphate transaminase n=1 Tax=unclassified Pseudoclavibacter TaxID=2615177 RepID=UPI001BAB14EB|nr:histidinol-phosphate transaminase [Pseudoclavibacter sp. Marseille-Q4354]MBS3179508.1 histidinol-phosphate transaminase [Pseudoclavibacter sp. Marseille-Q4354]
MTSFEDLPIRDDLRGLTPYGAPQQPVRVAINVNENPHQVPEVVARRIIEAIARELPGLNRYPDREFTALREQLSVYLGHGISPEQVWAANGSNEIMQQLLQVFGGPGRSVLSFTPSYSMYPLLTQGVGSTWVPVPRAGDFTITAELVTEAIEREQPDITIICSPNNPTGTATDLIVIAAAYEATDGILIVDEAYAEFLPDGEETALSLLPGRERLVVSRTMSKAFAFAGARVGYFAADSAVVDAVRLVRLPYHLSAITQAAATAALECSEIMLQQVDAIREQRDRLLAELPALGFTPWESGANFVLFGGVDDPADTFARLLERDILVRDVGIPNTLRVTAGTRAETSAFLDALAEITNAGKA